MPAKGFLQQLVKDLEAPTEVRRFGSGWLAGHAFAWKRHRHGKVPIPASPSDSI